MKNIEEIIISSLKELFDLRSILDAENANKLLFPIKRDGKRRVCEQEARLIFVKHLEKYGDFCYSIETPTKEKYAFSGTNERSGNIDICLYKDKRRVHLIEFKANNPVQSSYSKDFEKILWDEEGLQNYFIQVIENSDNHTISGIENKYSTAQKDVVKKRKIYKSHATIYLCDLSNKSIFRYDIIGGKKFCRSIVI